MRLSDLFNLERGPEALVKLAFYPLILVVVFSLVLALLAELPPEAVFGLFCLFLFLSPLAYFVRRARQGGPRERGTRGAERTPILPQNEEDQ
jgi:hypothetical protein